MSVHKFDDNTLINLYKSEFLNIKANKSLEMEYRKIVCNFISDMSISDIRKFFNRLVIQIGEILSEPKDQDFKILTNLYLSILSFKKTGGYRILPFYILNYNDV